MTSIFLDQSTTRLQLESGPMEEFKRNQVIRQLVQCTVWCEASGLGNYFPIPEWSTYILAQLSCTCCKYLTFWHLIGNYSRLLEHYSDFRGCLWQFQVESALAPTAFATKPKPTLPTYLLSSKLVLVFCFTFGDINARIRFCIIIN